MHEADRTRVAEVLARVAACPGSAGRAEFRCRHRDGSWRTLEGVGRNLLQEEAIGGLVIACRDVTERRRAEERIRQTEKVAAMGELLAGVAHELNNPLSVVVGRAGLLRRALSQGPLAGAADQLVSAADRCARIVRNFLALARQRPAERRPVHINAVVRDALELLAYPLRVDTVQVELQLGEGLPAVDADPHQLHQVVVNLLTNAHYAVRQRPAPRRILIRTSRTPQGPSLTLEVEDNGPGIPPDVEARLFEPFFTTKPEGVGTGLGLSLCRGIVESHGGTVAVQGRPGQGARFIVELPVGAPGPDGPDAAPPAPTGAARRRVLVVDDEADVADLLRDILGDAGHHVVAETDAATARERLLAEPWDIVLCDVRMPGCTGPELYRQATRAHPELAGRFVFVTGDLLGETLRRDIQELGGAGVRWLSKPFTVDAVLRAVALQEPPAEDTGPSSPER